MNDFYSIPVVIPSYNPDEKLVQTVRGLKDGTSSKEQPTLDGIISMSASPMEKSVSPGIENLRKSFYKL